MGFFGGGHNITTRADKINEFTVNTAEYGTAVPEVLGTTRLSGNVIYYDDFTAHEHRETHKSGKGGGSKTTSITYTYTVACILGLCEGEIAGIGKVWRGKEVYTYPNEKIELTAFLGTQTQEPWAYVVGNHPEKAMPYKGLAYMAGVVDMGNSASLPQYNFEIRGKLLNTGDGVDVNPADYIRYVLDKVGLGSVEIEGLDNYRTYCREADLLISSPPDSKPSQAQNIVNEIAKLTNAYFFWSNDRFKIVPLETRNIGSWEADTTIKYDLNSDDFSKQSKGAMVTYSRKDSSEVYNSFPVEFINRDNAYEKETVNYQLSEDIRQNGLRQASSTAAHYFYTKERAVKVAEMLAKKSVNEKNTYTFTLNWAFALLEPGDIVTLTDENIGIDHLPVRIVTTTENEKGKITCTAVAVDIASSVAQYDINGADRPYVNFNIIPPDTIPCIIQPPADLTVDGLELWIGGRGADDGWGGCTVYISDDNINYRTVGQINNSARTGALQSDMTADATSCVVSCNDVLLSGTQQDAERGNTLIWIGGECLSYTTATMLQNGNYQLDGLVRGQYNTSATSHGTGEQFARLDGTLLRESFRKEDVGKTLYFKFCSFNIFGAMEQSLADVEAYEYVLQAYYIPPVTNVTAYNRYRMIKDSIARYDIVVQWTPPNLQSYLEGQVWYKTDHGQTVNINDVAGVPVSQLGFQGDWIFGGSGKNQVVIPQAVVGDTYRIAVVTKDEWGASNNVDFAPQTTITVALKTETPNTPDDFSLTFGSQIVASWSEVTNSDIQFYEIRKDSNAGIESVNLLARTAGTSTVITLTERTGTLYLYAKSPIGKYSAPATLIYAKEAPPKPDKPVLSANLGSINIVAGAIPNGCLGMKVYINGDGIISAFTENNTYTHSCEAGIYDVSVAYVDIFGEGQKSTEARIVIKKTIDAKLLEDEAVNIAKVDGAIKAALEDATNSAVKLLEVDNSLHDINIDLDFTKSLAEGTHSELTRTNSELTNVITELSQPNPSSVKYASISKLSQTVDGIDTRVTSVEQATTEQGGAISAMQSDVQQTASSLTSTIQKLNSSAGASGQFSSISILNQTVSGLQSQVESLVVEGEGSTDEITALKSQVRQNTDNITATVQKLNSNASEGTQFVAISQLNQSYTGLQSQVDSVSTTTTAQGTAINSLTSRVTQTESGVTTITQKLNSSPSASGQYQAIATLKQTADSISATVTSNKETETEHNRTNVAAINAQADRITTIVGNLNDTDKAIENYSAIAQLQDNIELKVSKDGVVSAINLTPETARIRGKLITLDGDTSVNGYFWANAVQAKSIDVSKINADSLSALSANIGSVSGGTITGTTIVGSTIRNAGNTFAVDANGNIKGAKLTTATITSGTINASLITAAGFQVKASAMITGTVSGAGGDIPLPNGYAEAQCLWIAYQTSTIIQPSQQTMIDLNNQGLLPQTVGFFLNYDNRKVICCYVSDDGEHGLYYTFYRCKYRVIGIKG